MGVYVVIVQSRSQVQLFCNPMYCSLPCSSVHGIPRQEYWSGLPFPSPLNLPNPRVKPVSPALAGRFFTTEPPGKPSWLLSQFWWSSVSQDWDILVTSMLRAGCLPSIAFEPLYTYILTLIILGLDINVILTHRSAGPFLFWFVQLG